MNPDELKRVIERQTASLETIGAELERTFGVKAEALERLRELFPTPAPSY